MSARMMIIVAAAGLLTGSPATVLAQDAKAPAAAVSSPEAEKLLEQARKAIADMHAMSYTATVEGAGALAGKVPVVKAEVSGARADAGGWKLYTKGTSSGADSGTTAFEVAYDGVIARSSKEKDKVVYEKDIMDESTLSVFFSGQGAKHPIAWEVIATEPLSLNGGTANVDGKAIVGGVSCDIVTITPKAAPADAKAEAGAEASTGIKLWLGANDHLPRKIERLLGAPAGAPQSRVLTMTDFKTDADSTGAAYTLAVPDGYSIKSPDPKPNKEARKPAAPQAQPAGALAVGDAAPEFTLKDADGKDHKLSDYKGKVVLLDFWATWCPPCRAAMPGVQKLHEKFKDKPVVVIGVNTSESKDPVAYMKEKKFTYGLLLNGETIGDKYGIQGIPAFFIISPEGKLLWTQVGYDPAAEKEAEEVIAKAVEGIKK